jgi:AcrR family transcriptional regulator
MARPTKKNQIPNLRDAIKDTAWQQIAKTGAAALSLRAIARDLGITAPAIYNYFSRRDDLVTALIVDAFTSLEGSQTEAIRHLPEDDLGTRISNLGFAYREWALTYPQRYQLIFGTPIPNYEAPADITVPAAAESLKPLTSTLQTCLEANILCVERFAPMTPELRSMLEEWSQFTGSVDIEVLYTALIFWSRVHGLVSMEVGQQFPSFITDPGEVFRREIATMLIQYLGE